MNVRQFVRQYTSVFSIAFVILSFLMSVVNTAYAACDVPTRIMPLGDSITVGTGSYNLVGYRKPLWNRLNDAGFSVDFVGTEGGVDTTFDSEHEGFSGVRSSYIADNIYNWLVARPADTVLLHIGTNDSSEIITDVARILDEIDRYETDYVVVVSVIIAQIINRAEFYPTAVKFNENLYNLVSSRLALGDNLKLVDMEHVLDYSTDMYDNFHPNDSGYQKMADVWLAALDQQLTVCNTPIVNTTNYGPVFDPIPESEFQIYTTAPQVTVGAYDFDGVTDGYWSLDSGSESVLFTGNVGNIYSQNFSLPVATFDNLYAGKHELTFRFVDGQGVSRTRSWYFYKPGYPLRINVGGGVFIDSTGRAWSEDFGFNTGNVSKITNIVTGTSDPVLFQTLRWDQYYSPELTYSFAAIDGIYRVRVYLAETWSGAFSEGARVFDINLEGVTAVRDIDVFSQAGADAALIKQADVVVSDGQLDIQFIHKVDNPSIKAIEIIRIGDIAQDVESPATPSGLTVTDISASSVSLAWSDATDTGGSGLAGYRIFRDGVEIATTVSRNYTDSSASPLTTYNYTVAAYDNAGNVSPESVVLTVTTPELDTVAPTIPTGLVGEIDSISSVKLIWVASTDTGSSGLAGYKIYRDGVEVGATNTTSYIDTGLLMATAYNYTVTAYDNAGNISAASTAVSVTTADQAILVNVGGGSYVDSQGLTWAADYGFNTGSPGSTTAAISGTTDPDLYLTNRWDPDTAPELTYSFAVASGNYRVRIHMAETWSGAFFKGARVFDVNLEGSTAIANVDIYDEVGANTAVIKAANVAVTDGQLDIEFIHKVQNPSIRAIEVVYLGAITPDVDAPAIPTGLTATPGSYTVGLNWTESTDGGGSGLAGYRIYRDGVEVGTTVTPDYTDTGLLASTAYSYTVAAYDNAGNVSLQSAVLTVSTLAPDSVAPSVPSGLSGTASNSSTINLSWTASSDTGGAGLAGYRIYRDGIEIGTSSTMTYTDTGLLPVTTYSYTVAAYDAAGNVSAQSAIANVTTTDIVLLINVGGADYVDSLGRTWVADYGFNTGNAVSTTTTVSGTTDLVLYQTVRWDSDTAPEMAYSFNVTNGNYRVRLHFAETWSGAFGVGLRVFDVNMEGALVFSNVDIYAEAGPNTALVKTADISVVDGVLDIDFIHNIQNPALRAIEIIRTGDFVPDVEAPSVPAGLTANIVGSNSVSFSWTASTDTGGSGLAGYRIYRDGFEIGTTASSDYVDTGLLASTSYSYTVAAYDNSGNVSLQSVVLSVTTLAPDTIAPSVPTGLGGTASDSSSVNLSWSASTDTGGAGLAGYRIYRNGIEVGTSSTTTYTDTGLSPLTTYSYTVAAYDVAGNISAQSTGVNISTTNLVLLVNVGGADYVDGLGQIWLADYGYNTGNAASTTTTVGGTTDPALYQTVRWDSDTAPEMSYSFNVPNGNYRVRLHFAETWSGAFGVGLRVFDVNMEGVLVFANVDIYAEVGSDTALVKSIDVTVADGVLDIEFLHLIQNPAVRAIEIIQL